MTMTHVSSIEKSIHEFNVWIKDIKFELKCSDHDAYTALHSTLHSLRDRLPVESVAHLGAQLPIIIKGVFYDKWSPKSTPERVDKMTFTSRVHSHFNNDPSINPENVIQTVFFVMQKHIDKNELDNVKAALPPKIENLFDLAAQKGST